MVTRRQLIAVGVFALALSYLVAGGLGVPTTNPADGDQLNQSKLVQPTDNGSYFWPYTSRERSPTGRTLATNVLIKGDDDRVQRALTEQTSLNWRVTEPDDEENETINNTTAASVPSPNTSVASNNDTNETADQPVEIDESVISWNDAHGSTRYSYIDARPQGGKARWVDESFQIHAGNYFGSRFHIRAYTLPKTEWTSIQVHREYWDWFRLRHTVTDIQQSRNVLESDFLGQPYVERVTREYYDVHRGWNDGWLSLIKLVPGMALLLFGGLLTRETRQSLQSEGRRFLGWARANVRGFVLVAALVGLYLGVRSAGILLETAIRDIDPRVFLAALYPAIAVGMPLLAFVFAQPFGATSRFTRLQRIARRLGPPVEPLAAFGFTFVGLGAAFVLDLGGLGVTAIPVQLALHRVGLLFALGLIAAGSAHIDERGTGLLVLGLVGWVLGLVMPLFGYV